MDEYSSFIIAKGTAILRLEFLKNYIKFETKKALKQLFLGL